jgi:hypothetical protein
MCAQAYARVILCRFKLLLIITVNLFFILRLIILLLMEISLIGLVVVSARLFYPKQYARDTPDVDGRKEKMKMTILVCVYHQM